MKRAVAIAAICAVVSLLGLAGRASAAPDGAIAGVVRDGDGEVVPGATVFIGKLGLATVTGDDGRFVLAPVPPGEHVVEVSAFDGAPTPFTETIAAGEQREVAYVIALDPGAGEVIGIEGRAPPDASRVRVTAADARKVPGTGGDALKIVQNLPGVSRPAAGSGDVVVWGAAPRDTRVFVDGVPVPALYHLGGHRATVNGDLVGDLALVPGAYGAADGGGLGGIVDVTTRALPDATGGHAAADTLDGSALLHLAPSRKTRLAAAVRASWLDRVLAGTVDPEVAEVFPLPRWADAQSKLTLRLGPDEDLSVLLLGARDRLDETVGSDDPSAVRRRSSRRDFARAAVRWDRHTDTADDMIALAWIGVDDRVDELAFGTTPARARETTLSAGARARHRTHLAESFDLVVGADLEASRSALDRSGSVTIPAREGDIDIFGQPPGDDVNADAWSSSAVEVSPFAFAEWRRGRVEVVPGLRLAGWVLSVNRLTPRNGTIPGLAGQDIAFFPEPRLGVHARLTPTVTVGLDAGTYHQPRAAADTSSVFGAPTVGMESARHLALSGAVRVSDEVDVEAVAFARGLDDLVARTPTPTPLVAAALTQDGSGASVGAQLVVRLRRWHGLGGWIAHAITRSERRDHDLAEVRLFDHDQTHALTAVASWERGPWTLGARLRWTSGLPRTPVIGAFFDARTGAYQPVTGEHNAVRLPDFVQLDVRGEVRLRAGGAAITAYLDVQNATVHENAEEIVYAADYASSGYLTALPFLAVAGARVDF